MKKILLAAMAATMFAACTQNEDFENAGSNKEMKFNTAVMSTTRAGAMTNGNFKQFKLYAYTGTDNATPIIAETFSGSGSSWAPATVGAKFYWPGTQDVNFYGYSLETLADATYDATTAVATPTLTYTVKETIANQEDLLIADKLTQNGGTNATVSIPFIHALTKMSFKIAGDAASTSALDYTITGIKVTANTTGTYEYATGAWNATTSVPKDFTLTAASTSFTGATITPVAVNETLMMIPQTGATITINYTISTAGLAAPIALEKTFTFTDWGKGKNIAYTIKLPSDAIKSIIVEGALNDGDWATATETPIN